MRSSLLAVAALAAPALGQCDPQWFPADSSVLDVDPISMEASVSELANWDQDGAGGGPAILVVGGHFCVDACLGEGLAAWNGRCWRTGEFSDFYGVHLAASIGATTLHLGDLYVAGDFILPFPYITRWDGSQWADADGDDALQLARVYAMASYREELVITGYLGPAHKDELAGIARLDQQTMRWVNLDTGLSDGAGAGLGNALMPDGKDLIVVGDFTTAGPIAALGIARWDGGEWRPFDEGVEGADGTILAIGRFRGDIIVGGLFTSIGGVAANGVARWDGDQWHALGDGLTSDNIPYVLAVAEFNGDLYVGGSFDAAGGQTATHVARWDGSQWHGLSGGGTDRPVHAVATYRGQLYVGGAFLTAGGLASPYLARFGCPECFADFNGDGRVNLFDFLSFQLAFGEEECTADLAEPFGELNLFDFLAFQRLYGDGC